MNKINYFLKYTEYSLRKWTSFFTTDLNFHSTRLRKVSGTIPDIKAPSTLNEKICHRIIYGRDAFYTMLADKLTVRDYVNSRTRRLKTASLIGVYVRTEDINFNNLPEKFVLKCNHDSGSSLVCTNKSEFDIENSLSKLKLALKKNMYYTTREWQYKNISPFILCEEYIDLFSESDRDTTPEMLRIHCFHGVAYFVEADFTDKSGNEFINVYDRNWLLQPFQMEYPNTPQKVAEPGNFNQAILASQELAEGIDYCRIDLMLKKDDIYFSEITLSPKRGKLKISPPEWDAKLGQKWQVGSVTDRLV
ncbi:ATP-grasp fold amidoligase family protein [Pantoea piersonii]|uniref:ATP-grasp fold amidoligase family protein n=1 Tax=Pantoea piersonii TaxID=2364647 RepID=UPI002FDB4958